MSVHPRPTQRPPLRRRRESGVLAGVCTGLAAWLDVDVVLVRLAFAVATLFGGAGPLLYVAAWALVPQEGATESEAERWITSLRDRRSGADRHGDVMDEAS